MDNNNDFEIETPTIVEVYEPIGAVALRWSRKLTRERLQYVNAALPQTEER